MKTNKVRLEELTRKELAEAVSSGSLKAVIVPLGSFEQHQDHLPMIFDTMTITYIAEQVAMNSYPVGSKISSDVGMTAIS